MHTVTYRPINLVFTIYYACIKTGPFSVVKDIQMAIAFLTTIVREPNKDNWGEIVRVLAYLRSTFQMKLTLRIDSMNVVKLGVDASFAYHKEAKYQTRATMLMGRGYIISISKSKRSTPGV